MLRRVDLVRTDVWKENTASIIKILVIPIMEAIRSSETSVLTRAIRRNITEDGIIFFYTGYRFDASVRFPEGALDSFHMCSGDQPDSFLVGTDCSFTQGKAAGER
jgi:hypothetical protein